MGRLAKWLRTGQIRVDSRRAKPSLRLAPGQTIRIPPVAAAPDSPPPGAARRPGHPGHEGRCGGVARRRALSRRRPAGPRKAAGPGGARRQRHAPPPRRHARRTARRRRRTAPPCPPPRQGHERRSRAGAQRLCGGRAHTRLSRPHGRKTYWALVVGVPRPPTGTIRLALAKRPGAGGGKDRDGRFRPDGRDRLRRHRGGPGGGPPGWRCARAPAAPISCAPTAQRWARRSPATASTVAGRRSCRASARACTCTRGPSRCRIRAAAGPSRPPRRCRRTWPPAGHSRPRRRARDRPFYRLVVVFLQDASRAIGV